MSFSDILLFIYLIVEVLDLNYAIITYKFKFQKY